MVTQKDIRYGDHSNCSERVRGREGVCVSAGASLSGQNKTDRQTVRVTGILGQSGAESPRGEDAIQIATVTQQRDNSPTSLPRLPAFTSFQYRSRSNTAARDTENSSRVVSKTQREI